MTADVASPTFLYLLCPARVGMLTDGPTAAAATAAPFEYLQGLAASGRMLLFGRTANDDERTVGVVVFEAGDVEAAREFMANDPAVRPGIMRAELYPYRVAFMC